jgi:hypothetical protein
MPDADEDLGSLCRRALIERRLDAFDNVDVARLLDGTIDAERALWIGRHLMRSGRSLKSFRLGQQIVRRCGKAFAKAAE